MEPKNKKEQWILLDTETTGIIDPIYILEIYAQKMEGLEPTGEPLHVFLNHNVEIPPESTAIHGYTNEFIAKNGIDPKQAHKLLEEYCQNKPISSHNLGYDWCRCILPERKRLSLPPKLKKGFCTLQLLRRTLDYQETYRLEDLRKSFSLPHQSHSAKGDVLTVIDILNQKVKKLLIENNMISIESIKRLSITTPISSCREKLGLNAPKPPIDTDKPVELIILETLAETLDLTDVEDPKIKELDFWLSQQKRNNSNKKINDIANEVKNIVSTGIIAPEKRYELLEMIQPTLPTLEEKNKNTKNTKNRIGYKTPTKTQDRAPASQKQISYLQALIRRGKIQNLLIKENLSKGEASELIDSLKNKKRTKIEELPTL